MPRIGALGCDQPPTEFSNRSVLDRRMRVCVSCLILGGGRGRGRGRGSDGRGDGGEGDSYVLLIGKHGKIMQVLLLAILPILRTRFYDARRSINESI